MLRTVATRRKIINGASAEMRVWPQIVVVGTAPVQTGTGEIQRLVIMRALIDLPIR
jgi:hypothetical protein